MKTLEDILQNLKKFNYKCDKTLSMHQPFRDYFYFIITIFLSIIKIPIYILRLFFVIFNFCIPFLSFIVIVLWRFWLFFWAFFVFAGLWNFWYNEFIRMFAFIVTIIINFILYDKTKNFQNKMKKLSFNTDFIFEKSKKSVDLWNYETSFNFLKKFLLLPAFLKSQNNEILKDLKKKNIDLFQISEKILKAIEKISKYQKILPIFFRRDYINSVNSLILEEIQLLQNILEYSFHHQIQNHKKIISEISNLQNNEWRGFSEILELQKTRLENQKKIFEKISQK